MLSAPHIYVCLWEKRLAISLASHNPDNLRRVATASTKVFDIIFIPKPAIATIRFHFVRPRILIGSGYGKPLRAVRVPPCPILFDCC
jgi:hypothetical protein